MSQGLGSHLGLVMGSVHQVGQTEKRAEELGQSDLLDVALRVIGKSMLDLGSGGGQ